MIIPSIRRWGVPFYEYSVLEGAGLRFVCVANQITGRWILDCKPPLFASGKACPTPASELALIHPVNDLLRAHVEGFLQGLIATVLKVVLYGMYFGLFCPL
jgi:hypothetical protein